jgi:hypothetical protein
MKICVQPSAYLKETRCILEQEELIRVLDKGDFQTEGSWREGNIQDRLQLDEGDPELQILAEEDITYSIYIFISATCVLTFSIYLFHKFFIF